MRAFLTSIFTWIGAGVMGGWICGSIILSFGALIGRSGNTGEEYLGYWSPAYLGLSIFYGVPLGVFFMILMRFIFYKLNASFPFDNARKLAISTIVGGMIGSFLNPLVAALLGIVFFVMAFILAAGSDCDEI